MAIPSKDRRSPSSVSKSGEPFSGTAAADAPAMVEQTPRVCASRCVGYNISASNGFGRMALRSCAAPPKLVGQATWQGSQCRLHPFLARWSRGGKTFPPQLRMSMKFSKAGAQWDLALWAEVSRFRMCFRGRVCTLQRMFLKPSRCKNRWYILTLGEPAGIIPIAFTLLTRLLSVLRLVFSPSRCFYGTHLPGCLCPLSVLWAN